MSKTLKGDHKITSLVWKNDNNSKKLVVHAALIAKVNVWINMNECKKKVKLK